RLLALALGFLLFCGSTLFSFFGGFTDRRQAFGSTSFIEFTFGNRTRSRVATDNKQLLSHSPEVRRRPIDQHANWEVKTTDRKHCGQGIEHNFLGLSELAGLSGLGHVLTHQGLLH